MSEKVKAYLFARVASADGKDRALDGQELKLKKYCREKDYEIVGITKVQCSGFKSYVHLDEILKKRIQAWNFRCCLQ